MLSTYTMFLGYFIHVINLHKFRRCIYVIIVYSLIGIVYCIDIGAYMAYITFQYENCPHLKLVKTNGAAHTQVTNPHKTEKL